MISDDGEGWLELAETPPSFLARLQKQQQQQSSHRDGDGEVTATTSKTQLLLVSSSVASSQPRVLLQAVLGVEGDTLDGEDEKRRNSATAGDKNALLFLHPVLFQFLKFSCQRPAPILSSESTAVVVSIAPRPMLQYQAFQEEEDTTCWVVNTVERVDQELPNGSQISLRCIYTESDWTEWTLSDLSVETVVGTALEGRWIMAGCVLLLSTLYGHIIAEVTDVVSSQPDHRDNNNDDDDDDDDESLVAYRIWNAENCKLLVTFPEDDPEDLDVATAADRSIDVNVPGYESLVKELLGLCRVHGTAASASGILLAGCAGVGKSRLASCLAHQLTAQLGNGKVCLTSTQDLIFRASMETDLLKNVLAPQLRGCNVWIVDDLHLLECENYDGDDERRDPEYKLVQNALMGALDQFQQQCVILGIARTAEGLPSELTKIGRLEKTVPMLSPTQIQRYAIWKSVLCDNCEAAEAKQERMMWVAALASSTAGCVASDLQRIHRDAQTRNLARCQQNDALYTSIQWGDLREAAKRILPSQLAELDVIKPDFPFDDNSNLSNRTVWKDTHEQCWRSLAGYALIKKLVFRHVVAPWKQFLQRVDGGIVEGRNVAGAGIKEKSWLEPPPGVLFHGPSGNGKSRAARCLAASLGLPMIQVRAADVLDKWLGGSESLVRSLFARARAAAPCILFLDEIDAMAANREEDDTNDFGSRILSTLLNEMDGVSSAIQTSRILVVACTNRFKSIDSALLRPGRLQEHFLMDYPGAEDLVYILRLWLQKIPLGTDVDLEALASELIQRHATAADVEGLCREVCFIAMRSMDSENVDELTICKRDFEIGINEHFGTTGQD